MQYLSCFRRAGHLGLLSLAILSFHSAQAGSATWNATPTSMYWSNPANWTPATVPSTTADTATFGSSSLTSLDQAYLSVGSIVFNPGASTYTINPSSIYKSTMSGPGIINNSGVLQNINLPAVPQFAGDEEWGDNLFILALSATAGTMVQYTVYGSSGADCKTDDPAVVEFLNTTTAGSATFLVNPGTGFGDCRGLAGSVGFFDSSSADNATLITNAGVLDTFDFSSYLANVFFAENSTAANATIINYGGNTTQRLGGWTEFFDQSSAGDATIINDGGSVTGALRSETGFFGTATAGNATLIANGGVGEGGRIVFALNN